MDTQPTRATDYTTAEGSSGPRITLPHATPVGPKRPVIDLVALITSLVFYVVGSVASVMIIVALGRVFHALSQLQAIGTF